MISTVASVPDLALHLICLWYVQNNARNSAGTISGKGKAAVTTFLRLSRGPSFALQKREQRQWVRIAGFTD